MNKAYLLTICLLLTSFIGCIEDSNNLEKTSLTEEENDNEEDPIEPVGEEDISSLEKRVSDLEATIAEYEKPTVFFFNMDEDDYIYADYAGYEFYRSDDGYLTCFYTTYYDRNVCNINAFYYDINGIILAYSWEGSEVEIEDADDLCQEDTDPLICLAFDGGKGWMQYDVCSLPAVNQTLILTVYDNDGNDASASYELDYFTNCGRTYEPNQIPEINLMVEESSNGIYYIEVVSVSEQYDLIDYMFILSDSGGAIVGNNGFGEIAMTNVCAENCNDSNRPTGIDESYDGNDQWLLWRLDNMTNDDGSEYPVRFYDSDHDGKLSAGDQFTVYGSGNEANGPAQSGSRLDIWFVLSDVLAGSVTLP